MTRMTIETRYGRVWLVVQSLFGSRVLVVQEACLIPNGRKMRNGEALKEDAEIPEGAVLTPHRDPDDPRVVRHYIHRYGIYEVASTPGTATLSRG